MVERVMGWIFGALCCALLFFILIALCFLGIWSIMNMSIGIGVVFIVSDIIIILGIYFDMKK